VTRDDHTLGATEVGAGDDCVAVANNFEVIEASQSRFNRVGKLGFIARNRLDVADGSSQFDYIRVFIEV
jgi:hypothetical protein